MEEPSFARAGFPKMPPGFRFHPTDEELVVQYLRRKAHSSPLPASIIPEVEVCRSDPWDLPGDSGQERYFFSTREAKYPNGNRSNRATVSGYWKATGNDREIVTTKSNQLVGMKKTLVFYRGKPPHGSKTDWIMHEYRLASLEPSSPPSHVNLNQSLENRVLCRIFLKRRSSSSSKTENSKTTQSQWDHQQDQRKAPKDGTTSKPVFYEFLTREDRTSQTDLNLAPTSPSSGSSGLTNITTVS